MLVRPGERNAGHIIRLCDRPVRELLLAGHHVRYTTVDLVHPGHIGTTGIAYVPLEMWQEGGCGKIVGVVAREGLQHFRRDEYTATAHRGVEKIHRHFQGYDIIQGHDPSGNHRFRTAQLPVVFGHKRSNILCTVNIREQQLQRIPESLLYHHWSLSSEYPTGDCLNCKWYEYCMIFNSN